MMKCATPFQYRHDKKKPVYEVIDDDTVFNKEKFAFCSLGVVNTDLGGPVKIDDNWADSKVGSTTEVEFYAIGIDISGKKVSEIATDLGFTFSADDGLTQFNKA